MAYPEADTLGDVTSVTISLTAAVSTPSGAVQTTINALSARSADLARTASPDGGVRAGELREVLNPVVGELGFQPSSGDSFSRRSLSWVAPQHRTAISVHGGRAFTNNEVLLAALGAAAHPEVDWLIAVLPDRYKEGPTFRNVEDQLEQLAQADGIDLGLIGVTLVAF